MNEILNLVISLGLDFYLPGTLNGNDTSYGPDNDNENNDTPLTGALNYTCLKGFPGNG